MVKFMMAANNKLFTIFINRVVLNISDTTKTTMQCAPKYYIIRRGDRLFNILLYKISLNCKAFDFTYISL
jgi:hypothetical protein